jgi:hypothetical protein
LAPAARRRLDVERPARDDFAVAPNRSMNGLAVEGLPEALHVRNFQRAHGADRGTQRFIRPAVPSQSLSRRPQGPEDLRSIETLSFTMVAEAHRIPRFGSMPAI